MWNENAEPSFKKKKYIYINFRRDILNQVWEPVRAGMIKQVTLVELAMALQVICLLVLRYRSLFISVSQRADPWKRHPPGLLTGFDHWEDVVGDQKVGEAQFFLSPFSVSSCLSTSPLLSSPLRGICSGDCFCSSSGANFSRTAHLLGSHLPRCHFHWTGSIVSGPCFSRWPGLCALITSCFFLSPPAFLKIADSCNC